MPKLNACALACIAAAFLTGIVHGAVELAHPILQHRAAFTSADALQLWGNALSAILKSAGFLAGLWAMYAYGTKRGIVVRIFWILAVLGGIVFSGIWVYIAATWKFTILYVLGGAWYQMIAPVAFGIAGLVSRRMPAVIGITGIVVGLVNSQIFALLGPAHALIVQGIVWMILGATLFMFRSSAPLQNPP